MHFAFYAVIQDGHQKCRESDFCNTLPVHSEDTLWVQNFIKITPSRTVSEINALYAEIQDGFQKWWESNFCEKSPVNSADTLWVENFAEIALSCTVSKIIALLCFTQKFKMASKSGRKAIFVKSRQ